MARNLYKAILLTVMSAAMWSCGVEAPVAYGPLPTAAQVKWQKMEMNMFCHFGPNTFTGLEWGEGSEPEDIFQPTALDCNQWVDVARAAGMGGIILTAKHHDGFCLWPNPASEHTVAQSSWREGKGDILRELSDACRKGGVKFGVYISPWDRNAPTYGTAEYNQTFLTTLQDALTAYGPIFEQWFDGACGEGPNGKRQVYDWPAFNAKVAELQPRAVIFSDVGPGCHWMGNEQGVNGETCWSRLTVEGFAPGQSSPSQDTLNCGNYNGTRWIPAETDVSIRPGWFYRDTEQPKSLEQLLSIYYSSVGRNSLLLLNVPPDRRGLIAKEDSLRLREFRSALDEIFATDLAQKAKMAGNARSRKYGAQRLTDDDYDSFFATEEGCDTALITLEWEQPIRFNRFLIQEYIPLGQRVEKFVVEVRNGEGTWEKWEAGTTIGYRRILLGPEVETNGIRIKVEQSRACPVLNRVSIYLDHLYHPAK